MRPACVFLTALSHDLPRTDPRRDPRLSLPQVAYGDAEAAKAKLKQATVARTDISEAAANTNGGGGAVLPVAKALRHGTR